MPAADTAKLLASLELEDKLTPGLKRASGSLDQFESKTAKVSKSMGILGHTVSTAAGFLLAQATTRGIGLIGEAITQASNLAETQSKVNVVFGSAAKQVLAFGQAAATGIGMSAQEAEEAAATYGNLFVSMGLTGQKAADMSTKMVQLAGDLASFNNTSTTDALDAIRSGLVGETEPLRRFGINLADATLRQEALRLGLVKTTKEVLPPAIKAQAAYSLILAQSKTAQGDFARTSGGLANQQRILRANLENVAATIGTALLPKITELVKRFNDLLIKNGPAIQQFADQLPAVFDAVAKIVADLPWDAFATSLRIAGQAAQVLVSAFTSMPPEVQTLIISLAAINKLSGGAVTSIAGELGKGLIKGVLGITAANVVINAANVTGGGGGVPGVPGVPGAAAGAAGGLLAPGAVAAAVAIGVPLIMGYLPLIWAEINRTPAAKPSTVNTGPLAGTTLPATGLGSIDQLSQGNAALAAAIQANTSAVQDNSEFRKGEREALSASLPGGGQARGEHAGIGKADLHAETSRTVAALATQRAAEKTENARHAADAVAATRRVHDRIARLNSDENVANARQVAAMREIRTGINQSSVAAQRNVIATQSVHSRLARLNAQEDTANSRLGTIARKDFSPTIVTRVAATSYITLYENRRVSATAEASAAVTSIGGNRSHPA